jgi:hypothetical protein
MKNLVAITILILAAGCATPDFDLVKVAPEVYNHPDIDFTGVAYQGDIVISQGVQKNLEAIYLFETIDLSYAYDLHPGFYVKRGEDEETETYTPYEGENGGKISKAWFVDPWKALALFKGESKICVVTVFNLYGSCKQSSNFEKRSITEYEKGVLQRAIIVNSITEEKVEMEYREYVDNLENLVFKYDMQLFPSSNRFVEHKGARIEIVEISGDSIRYRILDHFN